MRFKNYITQFVNKMGYNIVGHHHIYIKDQSPKNINIEFLGFAGKTYTLKKYYKMTSLKKIKPLSKNNNNHLIQPTDLKLIDKLNSIILQENINKTYFKKIESLLNKIKIKNYYGEQGTIFWDEGIIKEFMSIFCDLEKIDNYLFQQYLNNYCFIILMPNINVAVKRYMKREKTKDPEKRLAFYDSFKERYAKMKEFIKFLKKSNIPFLIVDNTSKVDFEMLHKFIINNTSS